MPSDSTYPYPTGGGTLTMEVLLEAIAKLKAMPKNEDWLVVTPEGQIYKGLVTDLLPILLKRHPLCQPPKFEPFNLCGA